MNELLLTVTLAPELLWALEGYHTLMEAQLQDAHALERATDILGNDDSKDLEPVKLWFTDFKYQHRFANILRYSVITSAYSIFDTALRDLCGFAREELDNRLCKMPSKGSYVERVKTYLGRLGVDVTNIGLWEFFNDVTKVRNAIVHGNGFFYELEPEHEKHINNLRSVIGKGKLNGISIKEDGPNIELCVEKSFCDQLIAVIKAAIDYIYAAICCQITKTKG
jgi:hypothetical protein